MRYTISYIIFMMNHVEFIMHPRGQLIIYYMLDIIGQPYIKLFINTLHIVMNVKEWETNKEE
jgi:hypothetical protein